jgi:hypothetical protein
MDILIGGPDRPPSKRMIAQSRAEEEEMRKAGRASAAGAASSSTASGEEGYWAYMQRQLAERTEKLGLVGDSMESLEKNSSNWLDDVNKFVSKQKRGAATGREYLPCTCFISRVMIVASLTGSDVIILWEGVLTSNFRTVIKARFGL